MPPLPTRRAGCRGKREVLSGLAGRLGFTRILEALPGRSCLLVLGYHRVSHPDGCPYDHGVFDATPEQFEEQVSYLKSRFQVVELAEAQELIEKPARMRRCCVMLTFDDGYRDNYDVAFPILKAHGLKGVFFLTTSFVGSNRLPWWDQIAFLVRHSRPRQIVLYYPRPVCLDLEQTPVETVIHQVLRLYKAPETTDRKRFLDDLEQACRISLPHDVPDRQFLSWTEAAEMARAGMAFGSHTHTHEILSKLSPEEQYEELRVSRDLLWRHLPVAVNSLSYPIGSPASFSPVTRLALEQLGYRSAFSFYGGVNIPGRLNRFNILRIPSNRDATFCRFRLQTSIVRHTGHRF